MSRNLTQISPLGTVASVWDVAGRRTRLTYPGTGLFIDYDYLVTGETTRIRENGATSGVGVLATLAYDNLGRRTSLTRGNGALTSYGFDPVSRLASLAENFPGTASDQTATFAYNPASQVASLSKSNPLYAWTGHGSGTTASTADGLNRIATIGGAGVGHDARGNLTIDPTTGRTLGYWSENELVWTSDGYGYGHDTFSRIIDTITSGVVTKQFVYDGAEVVATLNPGAGIAERYVRGDGADELLVEYAGAGTANRTWLHQDERGSIVARSDAAGNVTAINRYDEYGKPQATNSGRFQYTGQMWLSDVGLYHYKARNYAPRLGRFLQTDPIGYGDGPNWYNYVGGDPVNGRDPSGTEHQEVTVQYVCPDGTYWSNGACLNNNKDLLNLIELPFPFNILPPSIGHDYPITTKVCDMPLSPEQQAALLKRSAVPGHSGKALGNGTYTVWAFDKVPGGRVQTTFNNPYSVTNRTLFIHSFKGQITRNISSNSSGTYITTHGSGNAGSGLINVLRDTLNQTSGPAVFKFEDKKARKLAKRSFKGC